MKSFLSFFLLIISLGSLAQENKIKAYLDWRCDENYIKQETSFLEYVRDQDLADVEIFIRDERNPTGSRSFEIKIDGNNEYGEISNTTEAVGYANDTSSSLREKLLNKLKLDYITLLMNLKVVSEPEKKQDIKKPIVIDPIYRGKKMSRNEPCFCGSGKKYKRCCGAL